MKMPRQPNDRETPDAANPGRTSMEHDNRELPLERAEEILKPILAWFTPWCARLAVSGEVRMRKARVSGLTLLAIPNLEIRGDQNRFCWSSAVSALEHGMKELQAAGEIRPSAGAKDTWIACTSGVSLRVVTASHDSWCAMLWSTSACRDLQITVATAVKNLGLTWNAERGGFLRATDGSMAHLVTDERQVFEVAHLPYMAPEERHTGPFYPDNCSGRPLPMTPQEVGAWVKTAGWVDTHCGGEYHQFSFRRTGSPDEREFLRMCEMIRDYGYDGFYHGTKWRYLDFEEHFYFTCGSDLHITQLINRKPLVHPACPWTKNPVKWRYLMVDPRGTTIQD